MTVAWSQPEVALAVVYGTLAIETWLSARNARRLLAAGAREVPDESYAWMPLVYPSGFLAVIAEGWWRGAGWNAIAATGVAVFALGKLVKYVAMATLGPRWCFRVLVLPGQPLVSDGIYRVLRHPNYVGVVGEVIGIGLWMQAPLAGTLFAVMFGLILRRRIRVEDAALGRRARG